MRKDFQIIFCKKDSWQESNVEKNSILLKNIFGSNFMDNFNKITENNLTNAKTFYISEINKENPKVIGKIFAIDSDKRDYFIIELLTNKTENLNRQTTITLGYDYIYEVRPIRLKLLENLDICFKITKTATTAIIAGHHNMRMMILGDILLHHKLKEKPIIIYGNKTGMNFEISSQLGTVCNKIDKKTLSELLDILHSDIGWNKTGELLYAAGLCNKEELKKETGSSEKILMNISSSIFSREM